MMGLGWLGYHWIDAMFFELGFIGSMFGRLLIGDSLLELKFPRLDE
jgi:hypothetical protein